MKVDSKVKKVVKKSTIKNIIEILLKGGVDPKFNDYDVGIYDLAIHPRNYDDKIFKEILGFKKENE